MKSSKLLSCILLTSFPFAVACLSSCTTQDNGQNARLLFDRHAEKAFFAEVIAVDGKSAVVSSEGVRLSILFSKTDRDNHDFKKGQEISIMLRDKLPRAGYKCTVFTVYRDDPKMDLDLCFYGTGKISHSAD